MASEREKRFQARVRAARAKPAHLRSLSEVQLLARARKQGGGRGSPYGLEGFKGPSDNLEFESYDKTDEYNAGVPRDPSDLPNSDGTTAVDPAAGNFHDENYAPMTPGIGPHIDLGGFTETDPSLDDPLTSATHERLRNGNEGDDEENAVPVKLVRGANIENWPDHLSVPKGSRPLFRQGLAFALQNSDEEIIELEAGDTQPIVILGYRLMVSDIGFLPIVPGKVLPPYGFTFLMDGSPTLPNQGFQSGSNNIIAPFMPTMARNTVALNVAPGGYDMMVVTPYTYVQLVIPSGKALTVVANNGGAFDRHFGVELYGYIANGSHDLTKFSTVG